jgi:hypothetical protein
MLTRLPNDPSRCRDLVQHEWLPQSLTLSKIRRVKSLMLEISKTLDLEVSTVALGYVYFEKLTMKVHANRFVPLVLSVSRCAAEQSVVNKENRKLIAAVCLLLAWKFNEGAMPQGKAKKRLGLLFEVRACFELLLRCAGRGLMAISRLFADH